MYKIIELEIDPTVSGNTGVFEVAWVEYPAIEQELMYFSQQKFYKAPDYVATKACQAIRENEKRGNPAGTQVGKVRAQQLCNQEEISLETVKRMKSYLERAATYNTGNWDDNGTIAYGLWGGEDALTWVDKILRMEENMGIQDFVDSAGGFSVGDFVSWTYAGRGEGDDRARGQIQDIRVQGEVNVPNTDFTLTATEERPVALIKTAEGKIVGQYIENLRQIQKPEDFVYPSIGESKDEFISRCIAYVVKEGKTQDEAAGQCYGMWDNREFALGDKASFDWDGTLNTQRGIKALENEMSRGSLIYIISARRNPSQEMIDLSVKYGFPATHIYTTGSNQAKVEKIKELGITRHYDDNPRVIADLGGVGIRFDYVTNLPVYDNYPTSGDTDAMLIEPELFRCSCEDQFDEDLEWTEDDLVMKEQFSKLKETMTMEEFEAVTNPLLRGFTESEIYAMNHPTPVTYFQYKRKLTGSPDRDFCMSIENRWYRRAQIDALRDLNTQFGHERQPYSKWLYKGGPNCVHAWYKALFQGKNKADQGYAEGRAGQAPKELPNQGYYNAETKRKSQIAYIVSQQSMNSVSYTKSLDCFGDVCKVGFSREQNQMFAAKSEQRMVYTPLMIPNILIPRYDEVTKERYYVKFTPETIEKIQQKFMIEQRTRATNYEHSDKKYNDAVMVESWLVEGEKDKAYELGFTQEQIPFGTWMGGYKILETPEGNEIWDDLIKKGKVKGMSVEGNFLMNFSQVNTDDYLLEQIINILNQIED